VPTGIEPLWPHLTQENEPSSEFVQTSVLFQGGSPGRSRHQLGALAAPAGLPLQRRQRRSAGRESTKPRPQGGLIYLTFNTDHGRYCDLNHDIKLVPVLPVLPVVERS
jgi:hypothetical protein